MADTWATQQKLEALLSEFWATLEAQLLPFSIAVATDEPGQARSWTNAPKVISSVFRQINVNNAWIPLHTSMMTTVVVTIPQGNP